MVTPSRNGDKVRAGRTIGNQVIGVIPPAYDRPVGFKGKAVVTPSRNGENGRASRRNREQISVVTAPS